MFFSPLLLNGLSGCSCPLSAHTVIVAVSIPFIEECFPSLPETHQHLWMGDSKEEDIINSFHATTALFFFKMLNQRQKKQLPFPETFSVPFFTLCSFNFFFIRFYLDFSRYNVCININKTKIHCINKRVKTNKTRVAYKCEDIYTMKYVKCKLTYALCRASHLVSFCN